MHFTKDNKKVNLTNQYFSSIDKIRNSQANGILYPYDDEEFTDNSIVVSSIIDHEYKMYPVKHTESRYAEKEDKFVRYTIIKDTITITIDDTKKRDNFKQLNPSKDYTYYESNYTIDFTSIEELVETYKNMDTHLIIDPNLVNSKCLT